MFIKTKLSTGKSTDFSFPRKLSINQKAPIEPPIDLKNYMQKIGEQALEIDF